MISEERLAYIEASYQQATEGPWLVDALVERTRKEGQSRG